MIYTLCANSTNNKFADMAEWQTRKLEVFVGRLVLVQVQLSAPENLANKTVRFFRVYT